MTSFDQLQELMHRLRKDCPWDRQQTLETLRAYCLEEAYECVEAINQMESQGLDPLIEELGDLLLQVLFQAELISEATQAPAMPRIMQTLSDKLIRRHPHVFENRDSEKLTAEGVYAQWNAIKAQEKNKKPPSSPMDEIPKSLAALSRACQLGKKAKKVKFDWNHISDVWKQVESEIDELKTASSPKREEEELGDILFSLAQWARHKNIDPEVALHGANERFINRYKMMEKLAQTKGLKLEEIETAAKEKLWQEAKVALKNKNA